MGGNKSKNIVYTLGIPNSEDRNCSPILRHPDANEMLVVPTI